MLAASSLLVSFSERFNARCAARSVSVRAAISSFSIEMTVLNSVLDAQDRPSPSPPGPANRSMTGTGILVIWGQSTMVDQSIKRAASYRRSRSGDGIAMTDVVDRETRSGMMSRIRGKNTLPELRVRRYLHAAGLRFRLHDRRLPGSPDLVFPFAHVVVFVHGCFWHRHPFCRYATTPAERQEFWLNKLARNVVRDQRNLLELERAGWAVLVIWECETKDELSLDDLYWRIRAASRA